MLLGALTRSNVLPTISRKSCISAVFEVLFSTSGLPSRAVARKQRCCFQGRANDKLHGFPPWKLTRGHVDGQRIPASKTRSPSDPWGTTKGGGRSGESRLQAAAAHRTDLRAAAIGGRHRQAKTFPSLGNKPQQRHSVWLVSHTRSGLKAYAQQVRAMCYG